MENTLLNLIPSSYIPEVHLSQYDIGRELTFKLMDGNTEYSVPSGATVTVEATKPSGLGFVVSGTFSGNVVTVVNTETMTNESGRFSAELSISSGATLLGTSNFIFNIERSPHPEGTTDGDAETLIPELTLLVNEIRESNAKVESMTASATSLPSGSEPTAEYDPDTNNLAFGIPVPEVTAEDLYKAFITKSANGSIASFSDGGDDLPMKSLKVNIVPKQSGSGDPSPSNVRPISGWDSVDVEVAGKNLFNPNLNSGLLGTSVGSDDTTVSPSNRYGYSEKIPTSSRCRLSFQSDDLNKFNWILVMRYVDGIATEKIYQSLISHTQREQVNIPAVENSYIRIHFGANSGYQVGSTPSGKIQVEIGASMTDYEPYRGTTYSISLGQTVYGGTLDVVSGVLTSFPYYSSYNGQTLSGRWICDRAVYSQGTTPPTGSQVVDMSGNGTEVTLTPTEVKTLLGSNNIWSESGTVEVEYRADSTLAYEELANAIISLGGNI